MWVEDLKSSDTKHFEALVLQVVSVEVVEHPVQKLNEHSIVAPNFDVSNRNRVSVLALDLGDSYNGHVLLDDLLEVLVELSTIVHAVALEHNHFVNFDELGGGDALIFAVRLNESEHLVNVLLLD
jgi:hypothetical protein